MWVVSGIKLSEGITVGSAAVRAVAAAVELAVAKATLLAGRQGPETDGAANGGTCPVISAVVLVKPRRTVGARQGAAVPGRGEQVLGSGVTRFVRLMGSLDVAGDDISRGMP